MYSGGYRYIARCISYNVTGYMYIECTNKGINTASSLTGADSETLRLHTAKPEVEAITSSTHQPLDKQNRIPFLLGSRTRLTYLHGHVHVHVHKKLTYGAPFSLCIYWGVQAIKFGPLTVTACVLLNVNAKHLHLHVRTYVRMYAQHRFPT